MSSTSTFTFLPEPSTWSSPPKPMSKAQPSPPRIHTLLRTSVSAMASRLRASDESLPASFVAQRRDALALLVDLGLGLLRGVEQIRSQFDADRGRQPLTSSSANSFC